MKIHLFKFISLLFLFQSLNAQLSYHTYVNPFIGTAGHGHTFPGAVLPFGMVQLSPDTRIDGSWDGCSGYYYSDSLLYGFSHTHLSGTGASDWGDILLMPVVGTPSAEPNKYASKFFHPTEKAGPGYYEVLLEKYRVKARLTSTLRTGIHQYTFPVTGSSKLILDLLHRDKTLDCDMKVIDSVTIAGYRISESWAKEQHIYFVMKFSKPFKKLEYIFKKQFKASLNKSQKENAEGACFEFALDNPKQLLVKVAISSVSEEGALKNLMAEAPHWDFEKYKSAAEEAWDRELSKVEIVEPDIDKKTIFYTALYHCFIHPSLNMDVDNQYRGRDNNVHSAATFSNYSVFSLWDTYRALNPLFTILQPARTSDFINTFLVQYQQSGRLPMWELSGNETDCMIGFHAVPVIADAMVKGLGGFDKTLAYEAMKAASNYTAYSIPLFNKNGYLQVDDESESVSKTLEYSYDNWCIAQVAALLGNSKDARIFNLRSQGYRHLFDDSTGFMRPRKNGNWLSPFYPSEINNHYTEGNSWQYTFYVPQHVGAMIRLMGGKAGFEKKLDELFTTSEKTRGREQADVTGLIGQYAHGNEPSHHMAYLYNYIGQPEKTIARVKQICKDFYTNTPDGLIGNEDCGQMSAWYVFSALGMYPVCPASNDYVLGRPAFKEIKINLDGEKSFLIQSDPLPGQTVAGLVLNNKSYLRSAIRHHLITDGGTMNFLYESKPTGKYGEGVYAAASKPSREAPIIPAPLIRSSAQVFKDKMIFSISEPERGAFECRYTTDGSEPTRMSLKYISPITISTNCTVQARVYSPKDSSSVSTAYFYKIKYDYNLNLLSIPNAQYAAEGAQTLIDGISGTVNWRKGSWLGFQGQDVECTIDLKEKKEINFIALSALQDTRSWIVFPSEVNYYGSVDNIKFELLQSVANIKPAQDLEPQILKYETRSAMKKQIRYLKIIAKNFGKLPEWHQGSGGESFIFVDEIEIR